MKFLSHLFTGVVGGLVAFVLIQYINPNQQEKTIKPTSLSEQMEAVEGEQGMVRYANYTPANYQQQMTTNVNFTSAASKSLPTVVHIKSTATVTRRAYNPFRDFFGDDFFFGTPYGGGTRQEKVSGSGSGVIISSDGYIVTNNHVIDNADEIEVTLNDKQTYKAKIVGTDPSTDIALLKIEGKGFPFIEFANSDNVQVGEWAVAVGNPFNLASTVTAGIISAKGRNINILKSKSAIESFIQTDAAVNPGNSGGALVNMTGQLIGINTAIATPTGTYAGYAFAVPSNMVRKIIDDLKKYGIAQRGYLGIGMLSLDQDIAKKLGINKTKGVYVKEIASGTAAENGGIKEGDIITEINNTSITSTSELNAELGKFRPGDKVNVKVDRNGRMVNIPVTLRNERGSVNAITKSKSSYYELLGADIAPLSSTSKKEYGFESGLEIAQLKSGALKSYTDIREGFVITKVNKRPVNSIKEMDYIIQNSDYVIIEGRYPGRSDVYSYSFTH